MLWISGRNLLAISMFSYAILFRTTLSFHWTRFYYGFHWQVYIGSGTNRALILPVAHTAILKYTCDIARNLIISKE